MPLTPAAEAILSSIGASFPALDAITVEKARHGSAANMLPLDAEPRLEIADRLLERPALPPLPVRSFRPVGRSGLPGIIFFHGGGFVLGDLESHASYCRALALAADAVIVAVDYRLAPEHRFPAAAEDAAFALSEIAKHAADFGIDAARLAVAGDSAGGNLATVAAISARDAGAPALLHQLLLYPVTDLRCASATYDSCGEGYFLTSGLMKWFRDNYLNHAGERDDPRASPLKAPSLEGLPPATMILGEYDPLRAEGEAYARRLRQAGIAVRLDVVPGVFHGFASMLGALPEADAAMAVAGGELRTAFARSPQLRPT